MLEQTIKLKCPFQDNDMDQSEPFNRPQSALGHRDDVVTEKANETMGDNYFAEGSNLFKGKSMPSLRYCTERFLYSKKNNSFRLCK